MGEAKRKKGKLFGGLRFTKGKFTTTLIVIGIVLIGVADYYHRSQNSPLTNFVPERTKGNPDAPLKILEFIDLQCPQCARGSSVLKEYMAQYPDGIYLSIKFFPLGELNSTISALYGECAAQQNKFWEFHDLAFEQQSRWRSELRIRRYFNNFVKEINLDGDQLSTCVESKDAQKKILAEKTLGESHFVRSTPTYFINEEMVVGAYELDKFLKEFFEEQSDDLL